MRLLVSVGILVFTCMCGSSRDDTAKFHVGLKVQVETSSPILFPQPPFPDIQEKMGLFENATDFRDLFPTQEVVRLEALEGALIGYVEDLEFVDGFWFVLDRVQGLVFQFSRGGAFERVLGSKGQGPGEYLHPTQLFPCFGNQIGVFDSSNAKILVYNVNGKFIRQLSYQHQGFMIIPNGSILWNDQERLILPGFDSYNKAAPWHVRFNPQSEEDLVGFGKREEPLFKSPWSVTATCQVGETIWIGSPYSTEISVYDLDGNFLTQLRPAIPNALSLDDFKDTPQSREQRSALFKRPRCQSIQQVGNLVLAYFGRIYSIFDTHGNLIRSNLPTQQWPILCVMEDQVVTLLPTLEKHLYHPQELQALIKLGWKEEDLENDNSYLAIGKLQL